MSSSESTQRQQPRYFCHECQAEMQPLMVPDPHCSRCHGTFVEEITDNSEDDPRNFSADADGDDPFAFGLGEHGVDPVVQFMNALMAASARRSQLDPFGGNPGAEHGGTRSSTIRVNMRNQPGGFSFTLGSRSSSNDPDLDPFPSLGQRTPGSGPNPGGPLVGMPLGGLLAALIGAPGAGVGGSGQMGDYALNQQALDEIITRLMESNQGSRPVPAPDDMIERLPRLKVEPNSPLLQKDCAVCKDSFEVTDTPSVITLPCNPNPKYAHSFHDECILPWLKQSGTCPVCRHEFVAQPRHHSGSGPPSPRQERGGSRGNRDLPPEDRSGGGASGGGSSSNSSGGLSGLWDMFTSRHSSSSRSSQSPPRQSSNTNSNSNSQNRSASEQNQQQRHRHGPSPSPPFPGAWDADLD